MRHEPTACRSLRSAFALAALLLATTGCATRELELPVAASSSSTDGGGGAGDPGDDHDAAASCILGTGVIRFIPLRDGDVVKIFHGPQGGYHVWGAILAKGLAFGDLDLVFVYSDASTGELLNRVEVIVDLEPVTPDDLSAHVLPPCADAGAGEASADAGASSDLPADLDGWGLSLATTVFAPDPVPAFVGRTVRMSVTATDSAGQTCSDSRTITPCF